MVQQSAASPAGGASDPGVLDGVFGALADPTRRHMLRRLADGERTITELAEPCEMSFAAASKHVRVLERAGLVHRTVRGRTHNCRLEPGPLADAQAWLAFYQRFWTARLDALETMLRSNRSVPETREHAPGRPAPHAKRDRPTQPVPRMGLRRSVTAAMRRRRS